MNTRRATFLVGIASLLGRISGMIREIVFSAWFGAGAVTDAFNAAFRVPQLLRELLAEGSLQNAFVPSFAEVLEKSGKEGAFRLANAFLGVLLLVLGVVTAGFWLGAELWVQLVAGGFKDDPDKFALTVTLTRALSPFLAGLSLAGLFGGMLNVRGRFFLPAMAQNVINVVTIVAIVASDTFEAATGFSPIVVVALGTTFSGFLQVALVYPQLRADGFRFRPRLGGHPALRKMLLVVAPALIGISTVQLNVLVESQWASSYADGTLTYLGLSFRMVQLPLAVVSGSVATAALTTLSLAESRGDRAAFGNTLSESIRLNSFLVLPSAVAFVILATPLTRLFYQRGLFTAEDTAGTAAMLQMYGLAVMGICFHRLALPVYFSMQAPRVPMFLSIGALLAKIPTILFLTRVLGMGPEALPLSHAVTVSGESLLLLWGLRDRIPGKGAFLVAHLKMGVAAAGMGALLVVMAPRLPILLVCAVGAVVYLGGATLLGLPEMRMLLRRRPGGLPPVIDAETQVALRALAGAAARGEVVVAGTHLSVGAESFRMVAEGGVLRLVAEPGQAGAAEERLVGDVAVVMRIVSRPPSMRGVDIAGQVWHAVEGEVLRGACEGPRIPVEAPSGTR